MIKVRTGYTMNIHPLLPSQFEGCDWKATLMDDKDRYNTYFQELWSAPFINVEQDIIFRPGALEELWFCEKPWCVHPYKGINSVAPMFGLVKFGWSIIKNMPDVWQAQRNNRDFGPTFPYGDMQLWNWCDSWFFRYAQEHRSNIKPHWHCPPVVNDKEHMITDRSIVKWETFAMPNGPL